MLIIDKSIKSPDFHVSIQVNLVYLLHLNHACTIKILIWEKKWAFASKISKTADMTSLMHSGESLVTRMACC